jgi:hypothetical protein
MGADRLDVKLIQFLLSKTTSWLAQGGLMNKAYVLDQDGIFGAHSREATIAYQNSSKSMIPDGLISPLRGGISWDGEVHLWTLNDLNADYTRLINGHSVDEVSITFDELALAMQSMPFDSDIGPDLGICLLTSMADTQVA